VEPVRRRPRTLITPGAGPCRPGSAQDRTASRPGPAQEQELRLGFGPDRFLGPLALLEMVTVNGAVRIQADAVGSVDCNGSAMRATPGLRRECRDEGTGGAVCRPGRADPAAADDRRGRYRHPGRLHPEDLPVHCLRRAQTTCHGSHAAMTREARLFTMVARPPARESLSLLIPGWRCRIEPCLRPRRRCCAAPLARRSTGSYSPPGRCCTQPVSNGSCRPEGASGLASAPERTAGPPDACCRDGGGAAVAC
jgi:hypothetical protein